jgi:hypothetical protein
LSLLRAHRVSIVCLAAALLVGLAAIVDHHYKQRRIDDAQVSDYFCRFYNTRCGGPSWHRIEARWQTRQLAYEAAVSALGGFALVLAAYRLVRKPRMSSWRSGR